MSGLIEKRSDTLSKGEIHSNFSVSTLQEQDLPEYVRLLTEAIREAPGYSDEERQRTVDSKTVDAYAARLQDPESFLFVARNREGKIVGVLDGRLAHYENAPEEYQTMGYTAWTGVDKNFRQQGVAKALKTAYEDVCRGMGLHRMQTFVKDANLPSIAMNMRMGYQLDNNFPPIKGGQTYTKKLLSNMPGK